VVLVGGVFDLLHYGHTRFLQKARSYGNYLVVAINRDEFVQRYKGKSPIISTQDRAELVDQVKGVNEVIINETDEDWLPVIEKVHPDIIVTSEDWKDKDYYAQMGVSREELEEMGVSLVYVPYTKEISTTQILERIHECNH
jgi:rfaE bifunctional protein nucleotidyltransferase chain/domain